MGYGEKDRIRGDGEGEISREKKELETGKRETDGERGRFRVKDKCGLTFTI